MDGPHPRPAGTVTCRPCMPSPAPLGGPMSDADYQDTVAHAAATPEVTLPYRELGVTDEEYQRIVELLGRRPTAAELAMYSVMWSEHCSYKSSKIHLRQFGDQTTDAMREHLLVRSEEHTSELQSRG